MFSASELSYLGYNENCLQDYSLITTEQFELMHFSSSTNSMVTIVLSTGKRLFLSQTGSELLIEFSSRKSMVSYSGTKFSSSAFSTRLGSRTKELASRLGFEPTSAFEIACNFVGKPVPSIVSSVKSI